MSRWTPDWTPDLLFVGQISLLMVAVSFPAFVAHCILQMVLLSFPPGVGKHRLHSCRALHFLNI